MPQGGYVYRQGTSPNTETVISSRFKIFTDAVDVGKFVKLGVTSSFTYSESKTIDAVRGLGYGDQIAELVPGDPAAQHLDHTYLPVPREPHAGCRLQGWCEWGCAFTEASPLAVRHQARDRLLAACVGRPAGWLRNSGRCPE